MHDELLGYLFIKKKHRALFMSIIEHILNKSNAMRDFSMMWKVDSLGRLALLRCVNPWRPINK